MKIVEILRCFDLDLGECIMLCFLRNEWGLAAFGQVCFRHKSQNSDKRFGSIKRGDFPEPPGGCGKEGEVFGSAGLKALKSSKQGLAFSPSR